MASANSFHAGTMSSGVSIHSVSPLGKLRVKNMILDGEIVCLDDNGTSIFNQLLFRHGVQYFYAFDLVWLNGRDLRSLPLLERKERLRKLIIKANNSALLYADHGRSVRHRLLPNDL